MSVLQFHITCVCKKNLSLFIDSTDVTKLRHFITCDNCEAVAELFIRFYIPQKDYSKKGTNVDGNNN